MADVQKQIRLLNKEGELSVFEQDQATDRISTLIWETAVNLFVHLDPEY